MKSAQRLLIYDALLGRWIRRGPFGWGWIQVCTATLFCLICTCQRLEAEEPLLPRLPELYVVQYQQSERDPFIAAEAKRTLVSGDTGLRGIFSGSVVQQYLQTITEAIKRELFVGGVSVSEAGTKSMAIINGVLFSQGDKIPLPIQPEQLLRLEELARTYGLPLERSQGNRDSISVEVGAIRTTKVSIVLPGFRAALCELPYPGDTAPEPIQLERKGSTP
jgi:hypothetical protein